MPGPVPKRSSERRRRNKEGGEITKLKVSNPTYDQPKPDNLWHKLAKNWYLSLAESGQAHYYSPSDWQHAYLVADILSRELDAADEKGKALRAVMLQTIFTEMGNLLTTEGQRRRLRLELERADREDKKAKGEVVSLMEQYKGELG